MVLLTCGCRSESNELMPLTEKVHWNYLVHSVNSYTDRVAVSRRIAVGNTLGYELKSNLGISHLGWDHGRLMTDQMSGGRFEPALPILAPGVKTVNWAGWIDWGDKREPAKAVTVTEIQKREPTGKLTSLTRSIVSIKLRDRNIELTSWFKPGLGLYRQDQRLNGHVDVWLEYLDQL